MQLSILEARVREFGTQFRAEWLTNQAQAEVTSRDLEEANAELERSRERSRRSVAHGATAGTFVVDRINDLRERYFRDETYWVM
jgi:putative peptide zinc metalloprotease protein